MLHGNRQELLLAISEIEWTRKQYSRALDRRNIVMLNAGLSQVKLSIIIVALAALAAFVIPVRAQDATEPAAPNAGFVDDWTHHHLVFSNPGARDDAVRNGTLDRWSRITNDPRYQLQQTKRTLGTRPVIADPDPGFGTGSSNRDPRGFRPHINNFGNGVKKDWTTPLGSGTTASLTATIASPLTNGANISGSSYLAIDGVDFDASAPTPESATLTVTSLPTTTTNATVTVTNGSNHFVLSENGTAASTTASFHTLPKATALATVTVGPSTFNLATTATASAYALTLDSGGETINGSITYLYTGVSGITYTITISPSPTTTGCTYASGTHTATGTFARSSTAGTAGSDFLSALNTCLGASDANIASNFTTGSSSGTVTITDVYLGALLSVTSNTLNDVTGTPTAGSNGTAASCTGASPYTVDYVVNPNTATMALNLYNELNTAGCTTGTDLTVSGQSGSGFTIGATVLGTGTFTSSNTAVFSFGAASAGSNGSNACSSSTAGTFGTGSTTASVATAISSAINLCSSANQALIGINNTSGVTGSGVTIYAYTPGTTGGSGISVASGTGLSTTGGGALSGGSNGTTSTISANPETFAYWSGNAAVSSSTLATTIAGLVNLNTTTSAVLTATPNSPANDEIKFTAKNSGFAGNVSVTPNAFLAFTGGTLSGGTTATVQPNAYPAKWGASITTASCANDFVVYPTGQVGSTTAANIIAYNELYGTNTPSETGCGTASITVPTVYWAFNTSTGYSVTTSPVISPDGTKVAFIQSNGTAAQLVVVKWAAGGTLASPATLTTASNITTCPTPCMTVTNLSHNDTYSSPYYDYNTAGGDILFVGDDNGYLEKFTGVFNGTAVSGPATVQLGSNAITSPVYDSISGCVFVGDTDGYLYSVSSGVAGSVCTGTTFALYGHSVALGGGANEGIFDGPLVDPVAGTVYVFVADSGDVTLTTTLNIVLTAPNYNNYTVVAPGVLTLADVGAALSYDGIEVATIASVNTNGQGGTLNVENPLLYICAIGDICTDLTFSLSDTSISPGANVVDEFLTNTITSGSNSANPVQAEPLGTGGAGYNIYSGSFDNVYFLSTTNTGNLYAVGNTGATTGATLYQIPITNGEIAGVNSVVPGLTVSATGAYPWPSPATEFYNNGTDYLFFSVNRGNKLGCTNTAGNGCILSYNINTTTPALSGSGLNVTTPGTNGCWATGGLVIDNSATTAGASQIYFINLNGAAAGGVDGATPSSSNCTAGAGPTIQAVQASQVSPGP
jgi:hypothetical protein